MITKVRREPDAGLLGTMELNRPVEQVVEMQDVVDFPPPTGANLLAISIGGKLCEVVWKRGDEDRFLTWMPYPRIPKKSKERAHALYFQHAAEEFQ